MLTVTIPAMEFWDEIKQTFEYVEETTFDIEHSLVSLSKWESKWQKAFLSKNKKTDEEILDYIRCMTLTPGVNPNIYQYITNGNLKAINDYIEAPMTATTFVNNDRTKINNEVVTAELIYYWMIALNIPFECQYWHLNRLLTLVKVCNIKNAPPKKMSRREIMSRNAALNEARRKKLHTNG